MLKNLILVEKWLKNPIGVAIWEKGRTPPGTGRAPHKEWRALISVSPFQIKFICSFLSDVRSFTTGARLFGRGMRLFDQSECLLVHFSFVFYAFFCFPSR
jgi:hypothetical protein